MEGIAQLAFQPAAIHPMIALKMSNHRLNSLSPFETAPLLFGHGLDLSSVMDNDSWIILVDAPVPQINKNFFRFSSHLLKKGPGLLELGREGMAVIGIPGKGPGAND